MNITSCMVKIAEYREILANEHLVLKIISEELQEIREPASVMIAVQRSP